MRREHGNARLVQSDKYPLHLFKYHGAFPWKNYFCERVQELYPDEKIANHIINFAKNRIVKAVPKKLLQEESANIIANMQKQQIPVFGLTSKHPWRPSSNLGEITASHLLALGIDFKLTNQYVTMDTDQQDEGFQYAYGLVFTKGKHPGNAVLNFIKKINIPIKKVVVIDNHRNNLEDLEKTLEPTQIAYKGFRYSKSDNPSFDPMLGNIQFLKFLKSDEVISDEEAFLIKQTMTEENIDALLKEAINSLAYPKCSLQPVTSAEYFSFLYTPREDY